MEKKIKPSDKPIMTKVVYGTVIAILCITAIVVGIISAANKKPQTVEPPVTDGGTTENPPPAEEPKEEKTLSFIMPVSAGTVGIGYDADMPVFSTTLGEWRLHLGIDILTEEDAPVYAAEDGIITGIYKDGRFGYTIEITHDEEHKTVYSNLKNETLVSLEIGDEVGKGDRIGTVGDSAISEIAEEPHLHFEIFVGGVARDPKEYIEGLE